jgi:hypothetical protein
MLSRRRIAGATQRLSLIAKRKGQNFFAQYPRLYYLTISCSDGRRIQRGRAIFPGAFNGRAGGEGGTSVRVAPLADLASTLARVFFHVEVTERHRYSLRLEMRWNPLEFAGGTHLTDDELGLIAG